MCIIDGNSSDGTCEFLKTLKTPFRFISELDNGIYDAMNKGIQMSKGDWLYFLGADDKLYDNEVLYKVTKQITLKVPNIISGEIIYEENDMPFIYNKKKKNKEPFWDFSMWIRNGLHHQGTFYKKSLFDNNSYNVKYKFLADYDFNLKMYNAGEKCLKINVIIAKCSGKGVSKSGTWELYLEEYKLKESHSFWIFAIFHFSNIVVKYFLRKRMNV